MMKKSLILSLMSILFVSTANAEITSRSYVDGIVDAIRVDVNAGETTGSIVKSIAASTDKTGINVTLGKVTDADIDDGTISQAKIKDLATSLNAKQGTLTADNGVTIADNKVSGVAATTTSYGVVKYGAIPASSTGTGEASIWVE